MAKFPPVLNKQEAEEAYAKVVKFQDTIGDTFWEMYRDDRYIDLLKSVDSLLDKLSDIEREILDQSEEDSEK